MKKYFKSSFIKEYRLKKIKHFIASVLGYLSYLIPKDKNLIVAFVDYETVDGQLIPYEFDNVYLLANKIKQENDNAKIVFLASNQFGGKGKQTTKQKLYSFYVRLRARLLLFKQPPQLYQIYTKSQYVFCLGYFAMPFKSDYWDLKKWWVFYADIFKDVELNSMELEPFRKGVLSHFTYRDNAFRNTNLFYSVCSDYAGDVIAKSHNIPREAFVSLGSPKSNAIFDKEVPLAKMFNIKHDINKVVLFTPTFRDKNIRKQFDGCKEDVLEAIFGFAYENGLEKLEQLLVDTNTILITKLHKSFQYYRDIEAYCNKTGKANLKNFYFLDFETEKKFDISLYDLFKVSDAMISDYSSISFDYLNYDKPIIYNFYDLEEYNDYRGLSFENIEDFTAGDMVYTIDELCDAIEKVTKGVDEYSKQREILKNKIGISEENKSLDTIYQYLCDNKIINTIG